MNEFLLEDYEVDLLLRALEGYAAIVGLIKSPEADEVRALAEKIQEQA